MDVHEALRWTDRFSEVLMKDDREVFARMLSDLNIDALEDLQLGKEPFELVCMTLIFQQQMMINWLLKRIESLS